MRITHLAFVSALPLLVVACDNGNSVSPVPTDAQPDATQDHIHTTGIEQGFWPPQPEGITNAIALPASALSGAQSSVLDAARRNVLSNPSVRSLLGDNYQEFPGNISPAKDDRVADFQFYNYSTNQTLKVSLNDDGSVSAQANSAAEFQPPEHPQEIERAIELARADLSAGGYDLSGLTGRALLAFPPASDLAAVSEQFYPERLLYVTFGPGDGELPNYSALVNLSTSAVTESGLVK